MLIEPLVTRLAAQRASEEELDRLEDIYMSMKIADENRSLSDFYPACVEFHITVFDICHNDLTSRLSRISLSLCDYHFRVEETTNEYVGGISAMYFQVLTLMRARKAEEAERAMQNLLDMIIGELKELHAKQQSTKTEISDRIAVN